MEIRWAKETGAQTSGERATRVREGLPGPSVKERRRGKGAGRRYIASNPATTAISRRKADPLLPPIVCHRSPVSLL